jgi:hypothetical protein
VRATASWQAPTMAIRVTYTSGDETVYDAHVIWEIEHGVLKLGSQRGKWDTYISPSAWKELHPEVEPAPVAADHETRSP